MIATIIIFVVVLLQLTATAETLSHAGVALEITDRVNHEVHVVQFTPNIVRYRGQSEDFVTCVDDSVVTNACANGALDTSVKVASVHVACCQMRKFGADVLRAEVPSCCDDIPNYDTQKHAFNVCFGDVLHAGNASVANFYDSKELVAQHCKDIKLKAEAEQMRIETRALLLALGVARAEIAQLKADAKDYHNIAMQAAKNASTQASLYFQNLVATADANNKSQSALAVRLSGEATTLATQQHNTSMAYAVRLAGEATTLATQQHDTAMAFAAQVNTTIHNKLTALEEDARYRQWFEDNSTSMRVIGVLVVLTNTMCFLLGLLSTGERSIHCVVQLALTICLQTGIYSFFPVRWQPLGGWGDVAIVLVTQLLSALAFELAARRRPAYDREVLTSALREDMEHNPKTYRHAIDLVSGEAIRKTGSNLHAVFQTAKEGHAKAYFGTKVVTSDDLLTCSHRTVDRVNGIDVLARVDPFSLLQNASFESKSKAMFYGGNVPSSASVGKQKKQSRCSSCALPSLPSPFFELTLMVVLVSLGWIVKVLTGHA